MANLYDKADIYDLMFDERMGNIVKEHWKIMLDDTKIKTILDCSIGTGNLSLVLAESGYVLSGSDLSDKMLKRCLNKAEEKSLNVSLFKSDFRNINITAPQKYDCVMSTGNALPYVSNEEVALTLKNMDKLVNTGGYIYLDVRNWDKILKNRPRFYFYKPKYIDDTRMDVIQFWDYNSNGSITFNIVYSFEKEQKVYKREIFEETYNPIKKNFIITTLNEMGYRIVANKNFPAQLPTPVEDYDWYCILAQK
ncbi:class I SAM-dependent methyltransferase [Sedimentibacter sp. zth1]|uniref:class I SAM-dependent DNA methyltransferase n=1 Tax=Sedimentibacter sp. zth1 TaxID=2816908 RepID=UPI001A923686|nr:class I SAM-dependent methyltransferase [Sedimentibacter sp. zth1]QSX05681.1 class I SAM-dependent methyltransferase [Sedimentibacter sp. zth1]